MAHSPAPWTAYEFWLNWHIKDANGDEVVYEIAGGDSGPFDAALIAAAPELLEQCKNALSYMEAYNRISPTICEYELKIANSLKSVIAKAEPK